MRTIETAECIHVISEPGDMTLYDFFLHRDGPDDFTIAPGKSTFKFPQRINYYLAVAILEDWEDGKITVEASAADYNCNLFTLLEVCRTIKEVCLT